MALTESLNKSLFNLAMRVQKLDVEIELSIPEEIGIWIDESLGLDRKSVWASLHDPEQGTSVVACQLATNGLVCYKAEQYKWVREGILSVPKGFTSV